VRTPFPSFLAKPFPFAGVIRLWAAVQWGTLPRWRPRPNPASSGDQGDGMNFLGKVSVVPSVPERLTGLTDLSCNLRWSWTPEAPLLFAELDPGLSERGQHNPAMLLAIVSQARLDEAAQDPTYLKTVDAVMEAFRAYLNPP